VLAAGDLFSAQGWSGTTIADIARAARVTPQAVHQSVGAKPALLIAAVQRAVGGDAAELPLVQREPFRIAYAADTPLPERAAAFAKGTREVYQRAGRLFLVLAQASPLDLELSELWDRARARRLADCRTLVSATAARSRATLDRLTDLLFVQSGPGVYAELVSERGWSGRAYQAWLASSVETLLQTNAGRS
jgi:AcrR family transcriptional regulator